jgi:hypothetical protein
MDLTINDEKMKGLMKEILVEMIKDKRDLFHEIIREALEETALANAITEGRQNDFVSEDTIMEILEG